MKLGWRPAPPDPRTLKLARYTTGALPPPPKAADWLRKVAVWPMLDNDAIGDCYPAGCCHLEQAWSSNIGGTYTPTNADVLAAYSAVGGYDPTQTQPDGSNPTDNGCTSLKMLGYWRRVGINGHRVAAYVALDPTNHTEVKQAISLFGGIMVAVNLPISAQAQVERRIVWRPTPGAKGRAGSWGGHAIHVGAYDPRYLTCVTWGDTQEMTWAFWDRYVMEAYALVSASWLVAPTNQSPTGLDMDALLSDLQAVICA